MRFSYTGSHSPHAPHGSYSFHGASSPYSFSPPVTPTSFMAPIATTTPAFTSASSTIPRTGVSAITPAVSAIAPNVPTSILADPSNAAAQQPSSRWPYAVGGTPDLSDSEASDIDNELLSVAYGMENRDTGFQLSEPTHTGEATGKSKGTKSSR